MKIVIFGLSITSAWGNGHATTFRSLARALHARGHKIIFFEKDLEWYASNRDLPNPLFCEMRIFQTWKDVLPEARSELRACDVAMVGSYFPHGSAAIDEVLDSPASVKSFYDIDTPVTVAQLRASGTTVTLTILREGEPKPLQFTVERAEIPHYSVDLHFLLRPGIGYLHVASFDETTDDEVQSALSQFGALQGLVLDLRQDPGGLLNAAVGVAGQFLPKGAVVVSQAGRASPEKVYRATRGEEGKPYPIVALVDRGTASGAEIVAGAIQDHDRGLIAGENTFGKGLVQTVFPLSQETGLALTTAKYYTPSGRLIQRNYNGVSLYDYYFERDDGNSTAGREMKYTDSGRPVYGGDGISPDVKIPPPKHNAFQDALLVHYAFFNFAQEYLKQHHLTQNFQLNDQVMQDFRSFLSRQNLTYSEADLAQNLDWVKWNLRSELFTDQFGMEAGLKVHAEADPEVVEALKLLPQARQLAQNARRIIAERRTAASLQGAHASAVRR